MCLQIRVLGRRFRLLKQRQVDRRSQDSSMVPGISGKRDI